MRVFVKSCAVLLIAFLIAVATISAQIPPAPMKLSWEAMFAPPGLPSPQIAMAMDCLSPDYCIIPGASNGAGASINLYNGKINGIVTPMNDANMSLLYTDVVVGGTPSNPAGVVSGVDDFGVGAGLQYMNTKNSWTASAMPQEFVWVSEAVSSTSDFGIVIAIGEGPFTGGPQFMVSTDKGASFTAQPIKFKPPTQLMGNCSAPGYLAMASKTTWYLTWGATPPSKSSSSSTSSSSMGDAASLRYKPAGVDAKYLTVDEQIVKRKANGQVLLIKNTRTGAVRTHVKRVSEWRADLKLAEDMADSQCNFYAGYVLRTTNAGATWQVVFESKTSTLSYIACGSETHCTATGFNAIDSFTVATTTGSHWKVVYTTPPMTQTSAESVTAVAYVDNNEVWVGGSDETQTAGFGMFWSSKDGGATWNQYPNKVNGVMVVMSIDFTSGVGFAIGMTQYKTTNVLRYKKQADYGTFDQKQCPIAGCTFLCQSMTFPQGMCLTLSGGGSAQAFCEADGLAQYVYETTSCVGASKKYVEPVNQCLNATGGGFFENICPPQGMLHVAYPIGEVKPLPATSKHSLRRHF